MTIEHGGDLAAAEKQFGIKQQDWLDLSTGINPKGWPVPTIPADIWRRLPTLDEELLIAAREYYQTKSLLAVPGSQFAIQTLPVLFSACTVAIPMPGYQEHQAAWKKAGHKLMFYSDEKLDELENKLKSGGTNHLVVINPNNPSCVSIDKQRLEYWRELLQKNQGMLIIDETFIDSEPQNSMVEKLNTGNLIILRSLGKFFGLAGVRLGFVLGDPGICAQLREQLGPWAISGAAQYLGIQALNDIDWQLDNRRWLEKNSNDLNNYLNHIFAGHIVTIRHTALFITIKFARHFADSLYQEMAKAGILLRLIPYDNEHAYIRFGLLNGDDKWQQFKKITKEAMRKIT